MSEHTDDDEAATDVDTDELPANVSVTFRRKSDGLERTLRTDNVRFDEYDQHEGWERVE